MSAHDRGAGPAVAGPSGGTRVPATTTSPTSGTDGWLVLAAPEPLARPGQLPASGATAGAGVRVVMLGQQPQRQVRRLVGGRVRGVRLCAPGHPLVEGLHLWHTPASTTAPTRGINERALALSILTRGRVEQLWAETVVFSAAPTQSTGGRAGAGRADRPRRAGLGA